MSPLLKEVKPRKMKNPKFASVLPFVLETLEERIAPAALDGVNWKGVTFDNPILLQAGEGLSTVADGGTYLIHVSKGQALVFATDLNGNGAFDQNEITGISAGDGLKMTSFVDINGDTVTNLNQNGTLSDLDLVAPGNDGRVLLNSKIDSITIRSLTAADSTDYLSHLAFTTYSIYGNIYAGNGFGVTGGGLIIDTAGSAAVIQKYGAHTGSEYYTGAALYPNVGNILTGTAASGQLFNFGLKADAPTSIRGELANFTPAAGAIGGDIIGVKIGNGASTNEVDPETGESTFAPVQFQIGGLQAGNGGSGARGGNISTVTLYGDIGGFFAKAGDGGSGSVGGAGGSITGLADLGSDNGWVQIESGDGGVGFNGKGGNGGAITLGQFSTTGAVEILLGDGGDGALGGGNGAGLGSANFTPVDVDGIPIPLKIVSTYRNAGDIGTTQQADFNGDGVGDIAYISSDPNLLVVRLGIPGAGINDYSDTYFLPAPLYSDATSVALTLGDFNGDGYTDVATASNAAYSSDGLYVYLWDSTTGGFDLPLRSAIPYWNLGSGAPLSYFASGGAITNLVVGDFNGDDIQDIGFTAQYKESYEPAGSVTALVVMSGLGDGYFYADIAYDAETGIWTDVPIYSGIGKLHTEVLLQASAVTAGDEYSDVLVAVSPATKALTVYELAESGGISRITPTGNSVVGSYHARTYSTKTEMVEFAAAAVQAVPIDFTILDIDGDGVFDVLSLNEGGVLVAFQGDDSGELTQPDENGIFLTGEFGVMGANSTKYNGTFSGIVTGDFDGDSNTEFGIYNIGGGEGISLGFFLFTIEGFGQTYDDGSKAPAGDVYYNDNVGFYKPDPIAPDVVAYSTYQLDITGGDPAGFVIGTPNNTKDYNADLQINGLVGSGIFLQTTDLAIQEFYLQAGDGGNSQLGAGGAGGSFGGGALSVGVDGEVKGSINVLIPMGETDAGFSQRFYYLAGSGGDGFTTGGAGGNVSGVAVRYDDSTGSLLTSRVSLFAGDGGDGVVGKGGNGGNVSKLSVETLYEAQAGDGGMGMTGGDGGAISGNGIASLYDAMTNEIYLTSGDGGAGINTGGKGGSISGLKTGFNPLSGGVGGLISYTSGDGGDAVSGRGGDGGSITNMSPIAAVNYLAGNIFLTAGDGGDGLAGGNGGSIATFVNNPISGSAPKAISFLAGHGGTGISQTGGNGGSISGVTVGGTGLDADGNLLFNRFLAGQGGDSYGGAGGNGGSLSGLKVSAQASSLAIAAGAGGDGLTKGGIGGSVSSSTATAAGGSSKLLVIAGDGGNAYAFTATSVSADPDLQDLLLVLGGVNGVGGNGGGISSFTATGEATNTDLIAGNGGNLMNYGDGLSNAPVGKGGSISKIKLEGNAGDIREDQAIQSYTAFGVPTAVFVTDWLAANDGMLLTNTQGNVGVVVGAAGRVSVNAYPDTDGQVAGVANGSVSGFSAKNIMSMVAGSVDRISAILSISGVTVPTGAILGAYKTNPVMHPDTPYYFDISGNPVAVASAGGKLMDGAILSVSKPVGLSGPRVFPK